MSNWDKQIEGLIDDIEAAETIIKREKAKKAKADGVIRQSNESVAFARGELKSMLEESGVTMEDHPRAKIVMRNSPRRLVQTEDFDIEALPIDLIEIIHKPDMTQIKAAMERGDAVPGFAYETKPPTISITIKPKTRGKKKK